MAKGLRCKTKRAFRAVKRQHVSATVEAARMQALQQRLHMVQQGQDPMQLNKRPLNKFLHPDAPDAVFPQKTPGPRPLDFRSESLPLAGLVGWGQRKKFTEEEKVELVSIFNCLPGRTEGSQVQKARETLRRMQALGDADMQEAADDAADSSAGAAAAAAGGEAEGGMVAEDAAAEMLADMRRQQIPTVKDSLKQHAARRPQGRFRSKRK
ncbi:hypothetical protein, conserved [Eimeria tenella]|uniref:DUF2423 domain-containing protein n=1 Tax=Eimeria tenella TaxID=5802 RepID=U6KNA7_EIMTE|nr:hypothetical protein, conserved [Eimeria tenella]CDJ36923.1 hypothetical protein, conserved [Eimeria tenella]|eukprot:XP_013227761.1 hypothetical protein, conserved [Eimeria tenella]